MNSRGRTSSAGRLSTKGGLVARLEFKKKEEEFAELGQRLAEARALAEQAEQDRNEAGRQARIAGAAAVRAASREAGPAPRDLRGDEPVGTGRFARVHVAAGEATPRGAALVTLVRTALPRLEASTGDLGAVMMVRSACGVPGPLPFTVREGCPGPCGARREHPSGPSLRSRGLDSRAAAHE